MKFKLSNDELIGLIMAISVVNKELVKDIEQLSNATIFKLYLSILQELQVKLQMKAFIKKDKYNIQLTPAQAIGFWLCFNNRVSLDRASHIGNVIAIMCSEIHQRVISKIMVSKY